MTANMIMAHRNGDKKKIKKLMKKTKETAQIMKMKTTII